MNDILQAISTVGFPIVIAAYLLTSFNKTLNEHTKSNEKIAEALTRIHDVIDKCQGGQGNGNSP